jgi:hypothetical protein
MGPLMQPFVYAPEDWVEAIRVGNILILRS